MFITNFIKRFFKHKNAKANYAVAAPQVQAQTQTKTEGATVITQQVDCSIHRQKQLKKREIEKKMRKQCKNKRHYE